MRSAERIVGLTRSKTNDSTKERKMAKRIGFGKRKQKIISFLNKNPNASLKEIVDATGCVSSYAHIVRKAWQDENASRRIIETIQQAAKDPQSIEEKRAVTAKAKEEVAYHATKIAERHAAQEVSKQFAQEFSRQTTLLGLKFVRMYIDDEIRNLEARL